MKTSRRDLTFIISLLVMILIMAAAVRAYNLGNQSLWSDEGNSAALAARSFVQITRDAAHDIHPPLYYWLLHLWTQLFGTSEIGLRSLSVVLGTLLVWATAELARTLYGESIGLATAFVAALAPFQVYYSQEARMYVLLALLGVLSLLLLWRLVRREANRPQAAPVPRIGGVMGFSAWHLILLVVWIAGLYTHYLFPLVVALATGLYVLWLWSDRKAGRLRLRLAQWGTLLAVASLAFVPWLPTLLRQAGSWLGATPDAGAGGALRTALTVLSLGPHLRGDQELWLIWCLPALALLGALPWCWLVRTGRRTRVQSAPVPIADAGGTAAMTLPGVVPVVGTAAEASGSQWPVRRSQRAAAALARAPQFRGAGWLRSLVPLLWVCAPLAAMLVLGLFREAYLKFLLLASPAYCILLARGVVIPASAITLTGTAPALPGSHFSLRDLLAAVWITVTLAMIGAVSSTSLARYFTEPAAARDDYRAIAQFIAATGQPADAILLHAPGQAEVFGYYYPGQLPIYALPRQRPMDSAATLAELERMLRTHDKIYAVYWAAQEADPDQLIETWINNRGFKSLDQWHGNVRLAVYVMPAQRLPDEMADAMNISFGPDITLTGYRGWNMAPRAGEVTQVQLLWQVNNKPARRYKVFLQLLDAQEQVIAQRDAEPAGDSRPTDLWKPGEVIADNHGLLIRPGTPPGSYRRIVGLYDRDTGQRVKLANGKDYVSLPPISVTRTNQAPQLEALDMQYAQEFGFGGIDLLGHDRYKRGFDHERGTPLYPGERLHVSFYWRAKIQPRADWWFLLALNDSEGHQVATLEAPLVSKAYSTTLWQAGEVVRGEHDLSLPADLSPGSYRLSLTLLPDRDTPAGSVAYLGTVTVNRP